MVFNDVSKQCWILAARGDGVDHVVEGAHAAAGGLEGFEQRVVSAPVSTYALCKVADLHGVVHYSRDIILVRAGVRGVTMPDLTNTIHARSTDEARPEIFLDVLGCINAKTVHCEPLVPSQTRPPKGCVMARRTRIICNYILDPLIPNTAHLGALRVNIRQRNHIAPKVAVLNLPLVVVVVDCAIRVEVRGRVEGRELAEIG
jgi:hypothetical protein